MSTLQPTFQCQFPGCGLSYRRKEHLNRHARRHFQTMSFQCPFCDRSFARNDTLRQHVHGHHKNKELLPGRATRACNYCRSRRSRCNGRAPCEACLNREIQCSLVRSSQRHGIERQESPTVNTATRTSGQPNYQHTPYASSTRLGPVHDSDLTEKSPARNLPYIQAYFEKFHPHWPFLHRATFDPDHEPAFLLQSVIMMGLWVIGDENSQRAAMSLHGNLTLSIYQQRDKWVSSTQHARQQQYQDDAFESFSSWPMALYQGILLQIIFALLTSSKDQLDLQLTRTLPETPTQLLIALVHSCLKRNMFFYPSMLAQFNSTSVPEVYIWLGIEEVKRFTLALYKVCRQCRVDDTRLLDSGMSSNPRREPHSQGGCLLSLVDLQFALPDSDELWHASSDLAARVAENLSAFSNKNIEVNWISQTSRLLQPNDGGFHWI
ncbi:hypothetical protein BDW59DRAFT_143631 [Aspergillus cavernicola]|uniref:C2H2 type zinc finger domain protein n=1 Tax=Aspergillus cavernicola TaxID=176166 RepID=A0ABR4IMJ8_9EURO